MKTLWKFYCLVLASALLILPATASAETVVVFQDGVAYEVWVGRHQYANRWYPGCWQPAWYRRGWGTLRYWHHGTMRGWRGPSAHWHRR